MVKHSSKIYKRRKLFSVGSLFTQPVHLPRAYIQKEAAKAVQLCNTSLLPAFCSGGFFMEWITKTEGDVYKGWAMKCFSWHSVAV